MWGAAPAWEYQVGLRKFYKFSSQVCQILTSYIIYQFFSSEQGAKKGRFRLLHITYNNHLVAVLPPTNVLFKRRIKTNSILMQSKMALPKIWFEKIFAAFPGNRKCDWWFNTLQRQREKRMTRNWAAPSPTRAPSTSTCQDLSQSFFNLHTPHPLL